MFLLGGKAYTMMHGSLMQYCTSILGLHQGVQPLSNSVRAEQLHHWLVSGQREPVSSALFLSSHNYPNTDSDMLCLSGHLDTHLVSQGVGLSIAMPDGCALITTSYATNHKWQMLTLEAALKSQEPRYADWSEWNADWSDGNSRKEKKNNYWALLFQVSTSQRSSSCANR